MTSFESFLTNNVDKKGQMWFIKTIVFNRVRVLTIFLFSLLYGFQMKIDAQFFRENFAFVTDVFCGITHDDGNQHIAEPT